MLQRRRARVQRVGVAGTRRKQLLLGANAAVTRCLRRAFLQASSIKLASRDVSDSISLSQAVHFNDRHFKVDVLHWDSVYTLMITILKWMFCSYSQSNWTLCTL